MRFLGIGEYCDLGAMYIRLIEAGHQVKVYVENSDYHDVYAGMLNFTQDWRGELEWISDAGHDGIILFESAIKGKIQDALRKEGYQVIGRSAFGICLKAVASMVNKSCAKWVCLLPKLSNLPITIQPLI